MEIGSEFWGDFDSVQIYNKQQVPEWLNLGVENKLLLSGRTALDFIINDIKCRREIKTAYLPAYCCSSMVKPFLDNNIRVDFYNVKYDVQNGFKYDIDFDKPIDIFLVMNYYGFTKSEMKSEIEYFKNIGSIVIEDITHSLLNINNSNADYGVASIRKWMAIPSGAIAINFNDEFIKFNIKLLKNAEYINIRLKAMKLKDKYMKTGNEKLKPIFLEKYDYTNELLKNEYKGFEIDDISMEILNNICLNDIKEKRKINVEYIYNNLKETKDLRFVYLYINDDSCPLFVPVRVNKDKRDNLRRYLISKKIYCPVHWNYYPDRYNSKDLNDINQTVLSLVCDQRYGEKEMEYMVRIINEYMTFTA